MTQKRHLWYMDLGLATLERLVNHVIGYVMDSWPIAPTCPIWGPYPIPMA